MQYTKQLSLVAVIVLLLFCCSCTKGEDDLKTEIFPFESEGVLEIETSPLGKSLLDLSSKTYSETQLLKIVEFDGTLKELNTKYPAECIRANNGNFRVSYLGDSSVAVVLFDDTGNKILGNIHKAQRLQSDFDSLKAGNVLDEVREIDPDGEYLFLYTGRNDTPRVSTHYTKDGSLITITYDEQNIIIGINRELI